MMKVIWRLSRPSLLYGIMPVYQAALLLLEGMNSSSIVV